MSRDFVIDVINFVEMKVLDNNDDTYTAYTVSVQHLPSEKKWTVNKRYSDFETLYNTILTEKKYERALADYSFPSKFTFNSKSDFTKVRRKNEFGQLCALLADVEVLPAVVEDFLDIKVHLIPSRRHMPSPNAMKVTAVRAGTSVDDITISEEESATRRVMTALPGMFMVHSLLVTVVYILALYVGAVTSDTTTTFRKVITCASIVVTATFVRAIVKKREWELQAALAKRNRKGK